MASFNIEEGVIHSTDEYTIEIRKIPLKTKEKVNIYPKPKIITRTISTSTKPKPNRYKTI